MVPSATVNAAGLLGAAGTVVTEFGSLVLLVAALALGIWGVRFLVAQIRGAR